MYTLQGYPGMHILIQYVNSTLYAKDTMMYVSCYKVPAIELYLLYGIYTFQGYPGLHILIDEHVSVCLECISHCVIDSGNLLSVWSLYDPGVPWNVYTA